MCSLMEKDALIEKVAETLALVARNQSADEKPNEDRKKMRSLRSYLYSSSPENLDFFEIVKQCDEIQAKYKD